MAAHTLPCRIMCPAQCLVCVKQVIVALSPIPMKVQRLFHQKVTTLPHFDVHQQKGEGESRHHLMDRHFLMEKTSFEVGRIDNFV